MKFKIINESIALDKPFSKITEEDVINYLNLGWDDGQYHFTSDFKAITCIPAEPDFIKSRALEGGIEDCVNFIRSLNFPLKVYRGLQLEQDIDLDLKNLGPHWTVNPNLFFSTDSTLFSCCDEEFMTHIIIGQVDDQNDIDLNKTLQSYLSESAGDMKRGWEETEEEVYIPDPSKIQILSVMPFEDFRRSRMRR